MKNTTKKKTLLSVAVGLAPTAATFLGNGQYVEGGVLTLITVGLVLGYDALDDKEKATVRLPDGVDENTFVDIAERLGKLEDNTNLSRTLDDVTPDSSESTDSE